MLCLGLDADERCWIIDRTNQFPNLGQADQALVEVKANLGQADQALAEVKGNLGQADQALAEVKANLGQTQAKMKLKMINEVSFTI